MMLTLLMASALAGAPDQFVAPMEVAQPTRLELTPTIDGAFAKEEWDPFTPGTYLQWEPGRLFLAAQTPVGKDLVFSLDTGEDGWLVGRDNIEFRVSFKDGKASVHARELDATAVRQPIWRDRPDLEKASSAQATVTGDLVTIEAVFDDAGLKVLPRKPGKCMMRLDLVDSNDECPAYLPRVCMPISFADWRAAALPEKLKAGVQSRNRAVVPGEGLRLRMTFNGDDSLGAKSVDMRSLGDAEDAANRMQVIFPGFDEKGRAFVDYATKIDPAAAAGYRVMRGSINFKDGAPAVIEASYRIAPLMSFTLDRPSFDALPENNTLRIPYQLQVHSGRTVEGIVRITAPEGWQVTKGDGQKFAVFGMATDMRQLELHAPADAHGTFPIQLTGQTKERNVTQTCYVTIR